MNARDIKMIEQRLQVTLPDDCRAFLESLPRRGPCVFDFNGERGLFVLNDVERFVAKNLETREKGPLGGGKSWPRNRLIFAEEYATGNFYFMVLGKQSVQSVFFWQHDPASAIKLAAFKTFPDRLRRVPEIEKTLSK